MVILIGGSSHVGKTLMAQRLLERYHYPYLSLDHLKMGFIRSGMTDLTVEDDLQMRYWMWPFVTEIIKTVIENNQNLIIEGCYIPGEWAQSFSPEVLSHIRCVFIVMSERYLRAHENAISRYADVIEKRGKEELDLERLILCSHHFKADCRENHIPCIEIDSVYDVNGILDEIIGIVESPCSESVSEVKNGGI